MCAATVSLTPTVSSDRYDFLKIRLFIYLRVTEMEGEGERGREGGKGRGRGKGRLIFQSLPK